VFCETQERPRKRAYPFDDENRAVTRQYTNLPVSAASASAVERSQTDEQTSEDDQRDVTAKHAVETR